MAQPMVMELGFFGLRISRGMKGPELVWEAKRYQLVSVRVIPTHGLGSGIQSLKRGWTSTILKLLMVRSMVRFGLCRKASAQPPSVGVPVVDERALSLCGWAEDIPLSLASAYEAKFRVPDLQGVSERNIGNHPHSGLQCLVL